jgi:riboflavin kinase / FMN adenylyltransferase
MASAVQLFPGLAEVRLPGRPCHVAVGMFDGVHRGHRAVIVGAVRAARAGAGLAGVLTFWPHPSRLFRPDDPVRMIFDAATRRELIAALGVDFIVEQPFTRELAAIEAENFVPHVRHALPRLQSIHVGENWRFGRGRRGDVSLLVGLARAAGVEVVSLARLNHHGGPVSSTRIRERIEQGDMRETGELLGFPYFCTGTVVTGRRLGRTIGFPTLNLDWRPDLAPALGVYAVQLRAPDGGDFRPGVANFGVRPTVDGLGAPVLEVHVLGDCPWGPGDRVRVEWRDFIRPEKKFASVEELRAQIARDRDTAQGVLPTT